jgi:hypothetical protein
VVGLSYGAEDARIYCSQLERGVREGGVCACVCVCVEGYKGEGRGCVCGVCGGQEGKGKGVCVVCAEGEKGEGRVCVWKARRERGKGECVCVVGKKRKRRVYVCVEGEDARDLCSQLVKRVSVEGVGARMSRLAGNKSEPCRCQHMNESCENARK